MASNSELFAIRKALGLILETLYPQSDDDQEGAYRETLELLRDSGPDCHSDPRSQNTYYAEDAEKHPRIRLERTCSNPRDAAVAFFNAYPSRTYCWVGLSTSSVRFMFRQTSHIGAEEC